MILSRRKFLGDTMGASLIVLATASAGGAIGYISKGMLAESEKIKNYDRKFNNHNCTLNNIVEAVEALKTEMLSNNIFEIKIGGQYTESIIFLLSFINSATDKNDLEKSYYVGNGDEKSVTLDNLNNFKSSLDYILRPNITIPPNNNDLPNHPERPSDPSTPKQYRDEKYLKSITSAA